MHLIELCLCLFKKRDRFFLFLFLAVQIALTLLDILGVVLLTGVVSIAVAAVRGGDFPTWVNATIKFLSLENLSSAETATVFGVIAGLMFICKSVFSFYLLYRSQRFIADREVQLTKEIAKKFLKQDLLSLNAFSSQQYQHSLSLGINSVMSGVIGQTISLASELILQFSMIVLLSTFSLTLTVITIAFFIVIFLILNYIQGSYAKSLGMEITKAEVNAYSNISDYFRGYREILVSGKQDYFINSFVANRGKAISLSVKKGILTQISKYVFEISFVLSGLALSAFTFYSYSAENAASLLALFVAALSRISTSILRLQYGYILLQGFIGSTELFFQMLNTIEFKESRDILISEVNLDKGLEIEQCAIKFDEVNFRYSEHASFALGSLSFNVKSNSTVAFVGPSGGGKSTIADLIIGVIRPQIGKRYIFGKDSKYFYDLDEGGIAYVPQEVFISNSTILENVALGQKLENINRERVVSALKKVNLDEYVDQLPQGYETVIGINSSGLSGGQRQRLGIARALYKSPSILVLDEATSALDAQLEHEITNTIRNIKGQLTLVIIAHRLSTVMNCDQIFYVDGGKIVDSGTFKDIRSRIKDFDKQAELMGIPK